MTYSFKINRYILSNFQQFNWVYKLLSLPELLHLKNIFNLKFQSKIAIVNKQSFIAHEEFPRQITI